MSDVTAAQEPLPTPAILPTASDATRIPLLLRDPHADDYSYLRHGDTGLEDIKTQFKAHDAIYVHYVCGYILICKMYIIPGSSKAQLFLSDLYFFTSLVEHLWENWAFRVCHGKSARNI